MVHPDYHIHRAPSMHHFRFFLFPATSLVRGAGETAAPFDKPTRHC